MFPAQLCILIVHFGHAMSAAVAGKPVKRRKPGAGKKAAEDKKQATKDKKNTKDKEDKTLETLILIVHFVHARLRV